MCLVANLSRQFEFVQNAWIENTKFAGLSEESDPLLGNRAAARRLPRRPAASRSRSPTDRRAASTGHAAVRHGPGRRVLLPARDPGPALHRRRAVDGAHPATRTRHARGGGVWSLMRLVHRALETGLHVERRLEPFFRRALNRALREPAGRPDPVPDQPPAPERGPGARRGADRARRGGQPRFHHGELRRLHEARPIARAASSAAATPRRTASCAPRSSSATTCRRTCGTASSATPRTFPAYVRFSGPGPNLPPDIDDVGFVQHDDQAHGRPGPKLMDDEKFTQDLLARLHADLRHARTHARTRSCSAGASATWRSFYFLNPLDSAPARLLHAGAVERDAVQSAGRTATGAACPTFSARVRR